MTALERLSEREWTEPQRDRRPLPVDFKFMQIRRGGYYPPATNGEIRATPYIVGAGVHSLKEILSYIKITFGDFYYEKNSHINTCSHNDPRGVFDSRRQRNGG